jgi:hypothetical protein
MLNLGIALPILSVFHASLRTIEPTVSALLLSLPIGMAIAGAPEELNTRTMARRSG